MKKPRQISKRQYVAFYHAVLKGIARTVRSSRVVCNNPHNGKGRFCSKNCTKTYA